MKSIFNEFINQKFYRILCLIVTFVFFVLSIWMIIFYWLDQMGFFSYWAYDFILNHPLNIMPEFLDQTGLISFLYYAFIVLLHLFSASCLATLILSIITKTSKLRYFSLCFTFLILVSLSIIETCSLHVINYKENDIFWVFFTVYFRSQFYVLTYYLIGIASIILIFLPLFYTALNVDGKKKYLYIFLFYFAALVCLLLFSSINTYSYIVHLAFNIIVACFEIMGVFVLLPFSLFTIFSLIFIPVKSIKIKVPIVCILTLAIQITYYTWFYVRPEIAATSIITEIVIWLAYIGAPAFPLTVSLYIKRYAALPNKKD